MHHCWTLVLRIHSGAFWTTNLTSAITSEVKFWLVAPRDFLPAFGYHRIVFLNKFQSDFPILCADKWCFCRDPCTQFSGHYMTSYCILTHYESMFGGNLLTYFRSVLVCTGVCLLPDKRVLALSHFFFLGAPNLGRSLTPLLPFHFCTMWPPVDFKIPNLLARGEYDTPPPPLVS